MKPLVGLLVLLAAAPATAAEPFGRKVRIALLEVKAMGAVQPETISGLNPLLARTLSQAEGVKLVTSSDLRAMVGGEKKQDLLSCSLAACMAETGRALGIDYVLAPEVAEVGGVYLVSLSLFSVARSRPVTRLTRSPRFDEQLRAAVEGGATELLERAGKIEAEPAKHRRKIAVLETTARLPLPGAGEGLGALIASEMAASGDAEVLASADIHALISADQHALLACDHGAPACVTEIGGALGVDQVVTSELSKAGADYVVSLSVVDIRKGQAVARVAKQVEQAGNLTDAASLAVKEALFELGGVPAPSSAVREGTIVQARGGDPRRGWGYALVGAGVVVAGLGTFLEVGALSTIDQVSTAAPEARPSPRELADAYRGEGYARGCWAGGLLLAGFGTYYLLTGEEPEVVAR